MNAPSESPVRQAASLQIRNLVKAYSPGKPVLKDISLTFDRSDLVAIIGPSGTGKSTLIRCVNRLVEPTSGSILLDGKDLVKLRGKALREARRAIGMVFQEYNLVERLTVMENLLTGRLGYTSAINAWLRRFTRDDIRRAFEMLDVVGLTDFANQRADSLSGGQRQRVGISRAVMQHPALILADEPTSSLDPKTSVENMELLQRVARAKRIPVIVNMHDVMLAQRFADRIVGMSGGHVVY
ncbi:MAG: phosphonate ABC transporter ATP-binding protein, partial [Noviherbaspirillum sp.]